MGGIAFLNSTWDRVFSAAMALTGFILVAVQLHDWNSKDGKAKKRQGRKAS